MKKILLLFLSGLIISCGVSSNNYILKPTGQDKWQPSSLRDTVIRVADEDLIYIRIFNGDDIQTVSVNGRQVLRDSKGGWDSGWLDITEMLHAGNNNIVYFLENTMTSISFGFEARVNDRIVYSKIGGMARGRGYRNDAVYPAGEVMRITLTVKKPAERILSEEEDVEKVSFSSGLPAFLDSENFKAYPETLELVLEPDSAGWASNQVFSPDVAFINGKMRLLFSARERHPGPECVGYADLKENGLPEDDKKNLLIYRDGYYIARYPYYSSLSAAEGSLGKFYVSLFYIWCAGEWAFYIAENEIIINDKGKLEVIDKELLKDYSIKKLEDKKEIIEEREKYSESVTAQKSIHKSIRHSERILLKGSDRADGHWMGRNVYNPVYVDWFGAERLYFIGGAWPPDKWEAPYTLGYIEKTDTGWSKPVKTAYPGTTVGVSDIVFSSFRIIPIEKNSFILFTYEEIPAENNSQKRNGFIKARFYKDDAAVWEKTLVDDNDIMNYAGDLITEEGGYVKLQSSLDLAVINGTVYCYLSAAFYDAEDRQLKQSIYRVKLELFNEMKNKIKKNSNM